MKKQNVVGPKIRQARSALDLTQEELAARCEVYGWKLSRGTLAKIEAQVRCVSDAEIYFLARALKKSMEELYPADRAAILAQVEQLDE
jgi:transcriptional regulator with XRE-family HTH domain